MGVIQLRHGHPTLVLAPMEGVTDAPMREWMGRLGAFSYAVTEFYRISHTIPKPGAFRDPFPEMANNATTHSGLPVQLQLLGGDPEALSLSALNAVAAGATSIDINFGCPAPTVNRHDGGATLLQYPQRIRSILETLRRNLPSEIPLSAKFRLGWDTKDPIHENTSLAAEAGVSWIAIHGRTRSQGYAPPIAWEPIGEVRKRLKIPVIANGDIWTFEDYQRCREITGAEHFMLGRSALANPLLPGLIARDLGITQSRTENEKHTPNLLSLLNADRSTPRTNATTPEPTSEQWHAWFQSFVTVCQEQGFRDGATLGRLKQWSGFVRRRIKLPWIEDFRRIGTIDEALQVLAAIK